MSTSVFLLVLCAAFLHATWNIIVKGGANKLYETAINALGGGLGALFFVPFSPFPARESWALLAVSCFCHLSYYLSMAAAYRVADLTLSYTLMRGTAPMLTAFATSLLGATLGWIGWSGVVCLCAGIFTLALEQKLNRKGSLTGVLYALRTAFFIMGYTLSDGYGARLSGDAISYACWIFVLNIFPLNFYALAKNGMDYVRYFKKRGGVGIAGGLCGLASYGVAIWAMTMAPIALVAALRETSVIFGMIMAAIFLGEKLTPLRVLAILIVLAGAMLTRLG